MSLEVTVYENVNQSEPVVYEDVDYLSLVSDQTYGPPALVAPAKGAATAPKAQIGERVLYLNTKFIPMFEIVRTG